MEIAVVESSAGPKTVSGYFGNDCRRGRQPARPRIVPTGARVKRNRRLLALSLSAVLSLGAGCETITEHVVPHPKHAEKSVQEAIAEVFDGLARTERDLKKILRGRVSRTRAGCFFTWTAAASAPNSPCSCTRG